MFMEFFFFGFFVVLFVFMIFNMCKCMKQMKVEQEEKVIKIVFGVKVFLQGGIYGMIVLYDFEDFDILVLVEIVFGIIIDVYSQVILCVVEFKDVVVDVLVVEIEEFVVDDVIVLVVEILEEICVCFECDVDDK